MNILGNNNLKKDSIYHGKGNMRRWPHQKAGTEKKTHITRGVNFYRLFNPLIKT